MNMQITSLSIHNVKAITFHRDRAESARWVAVRILGEGHEPFEVTCFENEDAIELPDKKLAESLRDTLGLIRKAQERLCAHLHPDSSGDDRECLNDLLAMFDGPEQREIEKKANAALLPF